ncbi:hypothetical protein T265_14622, partial [Opisthorchis viverrini]
TSDGRNTNFAAGVAGSRTHHRSGAAQQSDPSYRVFDPYCMLPAPQDGMPLGDPNRDLWINKFLCDRLPLNRRLTEDELGTCKALPKCGTLSCEMRQFVTDEFNKILTTQDLYNYRRDRARPCVPVRGRSLYPHTFLPMAADSVVPTLLRCSKCSRNACNNRLGYKHYTVLITDGMGTRLLVMYAFVESEQFAPMRKLFGFFKEMISETYPVKTFVMDTLAAQIGAASVAFGCDIMLCYFYVRKAIGKHVVPSTDPRQPVSEIIKEQTSPIKSSRAGRLERWAQYSIQQFIWPPASLDTEFRPSIERWTVKMEPPSASEVSEYISPLKRRRSPGPGDLPPALFTDGGEFLNQCPSSLFFPIWVNEISPDSVSLTPCHTGQIEQFNINEVIEPKRVLFSVPDSEWQKQRGGQLLVWQRGVKEITGRSGAVGATRHPGWGPRGPHCAWLETLQDMAGHASRAILLLWLLPDMFHFQQWHLMLLGVWALVVCVSRYAMQRHHLTDILAGVLLGFLQYHFVILIDWPALLYTLWFGR